MLRARTVQFFAPVMFLLALSAGLAGPGLAGPGPASGSQTEPQAKLPTELVYIVAGNGERHRFTIELAVTDEEQESGLMGRRNVPADTGMLFVFQQPITVDFWMKDTVVPLDILFIKSDGTVATIAPNCVPYSLQDISSGQPVRAALELQGGTAARLKILPGDKIIARQFSGA